MHLTEVCILYILTMFTYLNSDERLFHMALLINRHSPRTEATVSVVNVNNSKRVLTSRSRNLDMILPVIKTRYVQHL